MRRLPIACPFFFLKTGKFPCFLLLHFSKIFCSWDVWLGNFRGNKYSHKHTSRKPNSCDFWDFSLDELIVYDIPQLVDYILTFTGSGSLSYIGFSQGSAVGFASLSLHSDLNHKIDKFIALAATTVPRGT